MNLKDLRNVINIIDTKNIDEDIVFDYFRVVKLKEDKILKEKKSILFFPVYVSDEDRNGWYINSFDLRKKITDIEKHNPNYIFVLEEDMIPLVSENCKYILVDNIMTSVEKLGKYKLEQFNGKIITLTGSVGKTTTVGFIQKALGDKCLRIYSKRITPLVLNCFIMNFLNNNYDYFVVEASLWWKEHISYFSNYLKPDMAIILNVFDEHIGVNEIKTISDITKFKSRLFENAKIAMLNRTDKELQKISIKDGYVYYEDEKILKKEVKEVIDINEMNKKINPYIKTSLSMLQETIAFEVAKYYGIDEETILERLKKSTPVEKRVNKKMLNGKEVIFDGDVSGVARLKNFFNHFYDDAYLIIASLTEGGEEEEEYSRLEPLFEKFDKVYINKNFKKYFKGNDIIYFDNMDFFKEIEDDAVIFLHFGGYYRKYDELVMENLEV